MAEIARPTGTYFKGNYYTYRPVDGGGSSTGGLWSSQDGTSWNQVTPKIESRTLESGAITQLIGGQDSLWYITQDTSWSEGGQTKDTEVFKSSDGANWARVGVFWSGLGQPCPDPWMPVVEHQGKLLSPQWNSTVIYESTDGSNWSVSGATIPTGLKVGDSVETVGMFSAGSELYTYGRLSTETSLYKSTDSGETWERLGQGSIPQDHRYSSFGKFKDVLVMYGGGDNGAFSSDFHYSENGGTTWTKHPIDSGDFKGRDGTQIISGSGLILLSGSYRTDGSDGYDLVPFTSDGYPSDMCVVQTNYDLNFPTGFGGASLQFIYLLDPSYSYEPPPETEGCDPETIFTVDEGKIELNTLSIGTTSTDKIVTRIVATYTPNSFDEAKKLTLSRNIGLYGLKKREVNFFIYDNPLYVEKAAAFWLNRFCEVWKTIEFNAFLYPLRCEIFDYLNLLCDDKLIASDNTIGQISEISFDPEDNSVRVVLDLCVKAGTMSVSDDFWSSTSPVSGEYVVPVPNSDTQWLNAQPVGF